MSGRLVTATLDDHGGGREVTVHVPSAPVEAVVFAGDGQVVAPWGADLEGTGLPPTMVVGVHRLDDDLLRLQEYSSGVSTLPAGRTAVLGFSAGAELALAMGVRHPDVYGSVLAASPGAGYRLPVDLAGPLPRTYLLAGEQEPFFLANATRWAEALTAAGAEVVLSRREGAHGGAFWRAELPRMVGWAFVDGQETSPT